MNKFKISLCILFVLSFSLFAKPIPFDPLSGIVEIDVLINGTIHGKFGIDTGADRFYINRQFALDNNIEILQALGQRNIQGVDGSTKPFAASIASLQLSEDITLVNQKATVVDFSKLSKGEDPPDGLIGYDLLKEFYVSIDYPNKVLELSKEEPRFLSGRKYTEIAFRSYRHLIIVDVVLNDQLTVPMLLDYCATHTTLSSHLAELLEISIPKNNQIVLESVHIEGVKAKNVQASITDLSDLKRSTPRAKYEGIIGSSFLYNYNITVDYKNNKIYIRH